MPEFDDRSVERIINAVKWVERQNKGSRDIKVNDFDIFKFTLIEDFAGRTEALASASLPRLDDQILDSIELVDEFGVMANARAGYSGYAFEFDNALFPLWGPCIQRCEHSATLSVGDPPDGTVDSPYTHSVSAVDINSGSIAGSFPDESGLSIDSSGNITGTPTEAGEFVGVITATAPANSGTGDCTLTRAIKITVEEA